MNLAKKTLRIALAQCNYKLGDLAGNFAKIQQGVARARAEGADLVVFSECALSSYLHGDILERPEFIARQLAYLEQVAKLSEDDRVVVVGDVAHRLAPVRKGVQNAAAGLHGGEAVRRVGEQ